MPNVFDTRDKWNREVPPILARFFNGEIPFQQLQIEPNTPKHDDTPRPEVHARIWPPVRNSIVEKLAWLFNVWIPAVGTAYTSTLYANMKHEHLIFNDPVHTLAEAYYRRVDGDKAMRIFIATPLETHIEVHVTLPKLIGTSVVMENNRPRRRLACPSGMMDLEKSEHLAYIEKGLMHRHRKPYRGDDVPRVNFTHSSVFMYDDKDKRIGFFVFNDESRTAHMRKVIFAFLLADIRLRCPRYRPRRMREMQDKALAVCMGFHARLGENSRLRLLPDDVFLKYIMLRFARMNLVSF
jgi:hypothetical protein